MDMEIFKALRDSGMAEKSALDVAQAISHAIAGGDEALATKADLLPLVTKDELRAELYKLKADVVMWYVGIQVAITGIAIAMIVKLLGH